MKSTKKIALTFCFTLLFGISSAQNFNKRIGFLPGYADLGFNAIENDSGYIMIGGTVPGITSIGVVQTDFNGNILFQKTYMDTNLARYPGNQGSLIKVSSGGYAMLGTIANTTSGHALLIRFNELGDTLWTKTLGDTAYYSIGSQVKQTLDGGFICAAQYTKYTGENWIVKTDSLGNVEWDQWYGGPEIERPTSIAVCNDGGYIFTGWTASLGPGTPAKENIRITKIDSVGNVEFNKIFGEFNNDTPWSISQTQDGGYIFGGSLTLNSNGLTHAYAIKLNSLGDTVWTRTYPAPTGNSSSNSFKTIQELPDGTFMGGGKEWFTDSVVIGRYDGFIIKLKPNGDTLWHKTYRIPTMNANGTSFEIKDIRPTTDGGFICAGVVYPAPPDTGTQDMWLFKIDSNGCIDTANCWIPTTIEVKKDKVPFEDLAVLYPNPANTTITIEVPNSTAKFTATFRLITITGKEVLTQTIHSSLTQLNVSRLPKGIYFYRLMVNKQNYSGKLVVN